MRAIDLVIKGGHLIDPAAGIDEERDIAISQGRVIEVDSGISSRNVRKTIRADGLFVSPGFVDLHAHVARGIVRLGVDPDTACLLKGTTTVVDAGSTGELSFDSFKKYVIEGSRTRIIAFINIESLGMIEFGTMPGNTDQRWPSLLTAQKEKYASMFVNSKNTEKIIRENHSVIAGIKWAHHGMEIMKLARGSATRSDCLLMIENHFMPDALKLVRRGDIVTHLFLDHLNRISGYRDGLLDEKRRVRPEFFRAEKKGVILDVGHGRGSFSWRVAETAFAEGLRPTTISTDLWIGNINGPVWDLPTVASKFLHLGMSLKEVIAAITSKPALALGMPDEIGSLKPGLCADLVIFKVQNGRFIIPDSDGATRIVQRKIVPQTIIRNGEVVVQGRKFVGSKSPKWGK